VKTLILIDIQTDFLPGGSLAVPDGDAIIPVINRIMPRFDHVIATQDWHPAHHSSFKKQGGPWPDHCVQKSRGAEISKELKGEKIEMIFQKGTDLKIDSYSAFFDNERQKQTGLFDYLQSRRMKNLYFAGLATDYCVLYSVLDALELGFEVYVIRDACRAIGDESKALEQMERQGAKIIQSSEIFLL
jgi:nicotinamidase/pyrazinamidase